METNRNLLDAPMGIDDMGAFELKDSARWAKFIGIVGMVISVILAIFGLFAGALMSRMAMPTEPGSAEVLTIMKGAMSVVYFVMGAIMFLIYFQAYRYGSRMANALNTGDQVVLNSSFKSLKMFFKIQGIIFAIYLGFLALALIFGIIGTMVK